jgi:hypothetical protein
LRSPLKVKVKVKVFLALYFGEQVIEGERRTITFSRGDVFQKAGASARVA